MALIFFSLYWADSRPHVLPACFQLTVAGLKKGTGGWAKSRRWRQANQGPVVGDPSLLPAIELSPEDAPRVLRRMLRNWPGVVHAPMSLAASPSRDQRGEL